MATVAVRTSRVKPARSVRLLAPLNAEGKNGLIRITVGRQSADYFVAKIPSQWGDAFRLEKVGHPGGHDDSYDVRLTDAGQTCECLGHLHHGHCKHRLALMTLRVHGKL